MKFFAIAALSLALGQLGFAQGPLALKITAHIQNLGDLKGTDGEWIGTKGESKRLELINIKKDSGPQKVKIQYRCHIENKGDTGWMNGGSDCGTRGQGLRLEAFAVRLTGAGAKNYKLFYKCHLENIGDTKFIKSPNVCGTTGESRRLEALFIKIQPA